VRKLGGAIAPVCVLVLVVSGCSADQPLDPSPSSSQSPTAAITALDATPQPSSTPAPTRATLSKVATAKSDTIDVYPDPNTSDTETIDAADVLTVPDETPLVFLVKTVTDGWLEVWLPVRPNGSTAWVRAEDVTLADTRYWIDVSLSNFDLKVYNDQELLMETAIGVGRDDRPTPGGIYYIRELLQPPDPTGIYGPYAYGLSGFSPVLDSFKGGDAVIGIHGTNDDTSFGRTVSSGCMRVSNDAITQIAEEIGLPLGTPIYINA